MLTASLELFDHNYHDWHHLSDIVERLLCPRVYWITIFKMNPDLNLGDESHICHKSSGIISELQSENFDLYYYFKWLLINKPAPVAFLNVITQKKPDSGITRIQVSMTDVIMTLLPPLKPISTNDLNHASSAHLGPALLESTPPARYLVIAKAFWGEISLLCFSISRSCHRNTESYFTAFPLTEKKKKRAQNGDDIFVV